MIRVIKLLQSVYIEMIGHYTILAYMSLYDIIVCLQCVVGMDYH